MVVFIQAKHKLGKIQIIRKEGKCNGEVLFWC